MKKITFQTTDRLKSEKPDYFSEFTAYIQKLNERHKRENPLEIIASNELPFYVIVVSNISVFEWTVFSPKNHRTQSLRPELSAYLQTAAPLSIYLSIYHTSNKCIINKTFRLVSSLKTDSSSKLILMAGITCSQVFPLNNKQWM